MIYSLNMDKMVKPTGGPVGPGSPRGPASPCSRIVLYSGNEIINLSLNFASLAHILTLCAVIIEAKLDFWLKPVAICDTRFALKDKPVNNFELF